MILAEKIMKLRKEQGWSQEELALRLGVSRQSVSKWESMASLPDLDKILKMSELFGVSTDYLLKDAAPQETGCINGQQETETGGRIVSLEEANQYLAAVRDAASKIALGVSLCILSPVLLILLTAAADQKRLAISETAAASIGMCALLVIVAAAVTLFVSNGIRLRRYAYLDKESIVTEYGASGIVKNLRGEYEASFKMRLTLGIALCILSIVPLMAAAAMEDAFLVDCAASGIFILTAVGVNLIVHSAFIWGSYQRLLEDGDFTREKKTEEKRNEAFTSLYWCLALALYLAVSFITWRWDMTWIIWPVAAILFGAVRALKKILREKS